MHEEGSSGGNSVSTSGQDMTKTNTTVSCTKKFLPYGQNLPPANLKVSDQSHFLGRVESNNFLAFRINGMRSITKMAVF